MHGGHDQGKDFENIRQGNATQGYGLATSRGGLMTLSDDTADWLRPRLISQKCRWWGHHLKFWWLAVPIILMSNLCSPTVQSAVAGTGQLAEPHRTDELVMMRRLVTVMQPGSWYEIPDSSIAPVLTPRSGAPDQGGVEGSSAVINDWNGSAYDGTGHKWYFFGGGHHGYSGNEVYQFDLETLQWTRLTKPSALKPVSKEMPCPDTVDGTPLSAHTYDGFIFAPPTGTIFLWPSFPYCAGTARYDGGVWEFVPRSLKWNKVPSGPGASNFSGFDPYTGRIVLIVHNSPVWFDPVRKIYSSKGPPVNRPVAFGNGIVVPELRQFWGIDYDGDVFHFDLTTPVPGAIAVVVPKRDLPSNIGSATGMAWSPVMKRILFWGGDRVVTTLDPANLRWERLDNPDGPAPSFDAKRNGGRVYSKWKYVAELNVFVGYDNVEQGIWIYRPPR